MNTAIPTNISGFEYLLKSHRLVAIAGRYGHGADILAAQFARHAAVDHGIPTSFTSCWSSEDEISARLISAQADVDLAHIRRGTCTAEEEFRVAEVDEALAAAPLFINTNLTLDGVAEHIAKTRARLAVVEGAHLLGFADPFGEARPSAEDRASDLSRELKILAMRTEIPIVATVPLVARDDVPAGTQGQPVMADLGDCWSFAGDSDALILTYRPDTFHSHIRPGEIDLIVAKDRHDAARTITACVQEQYHRIVNIPPAPDNVIAFPGVGAP
jgi:replicative DNA helicase